MAQLTSPAFPVALPVLRWGAGNAPRRALLVHGLTSSGGTWWRIASLLARDGWFVAAPDLRGHGQAPRVDDYHLDGFRADVLALRPETGPWDVVVGHSLGGAVVAHTAAADRGWARGLVLIDPVVNLEPADRGAVIAEITAELAAARLGVPGRSSWHEEDVKQKMLAALVVSEHSVREILSATDPWALEPAIAGTTVPITLLGADPAVEEPALTADEGARLAAASDLVRYTVVTGAGHSIHRDNPTAVVREITACEGR